MCRHQIYLVKYSSEPIRDHSNVIKRGGRGRPNDYVIMEELVFLLVTIDYRLGGWVKNDQDFDYLIFEWPLTLKICMYKKLGGLYSR